MYFRACQAILQDRILTGFPYAFLAFSPLIGDNGSMNTSPLDVRLDSKHPVEIEPGLFWVGFADYEAGFSNNPYLLLDEDEAILFDPGPGHPVFRDLIMNKIAEIINPSLIRYIVVHHQDPDLCGMIPLIEDLLHPELVIIAHPRSALFLPYYGIRKALLPVGDGDSLILKSGKRLEFHYTPYLHFAGAMVTYSPERKALFSSDIFGVFNRDWKLFADASYVDLARHFIEHYVCSKEAVLYTYRKLKSLSIKMILPQHGGIIREEDVDLFVDMLKDTNPGILIRELSNKPDKKQIQHLLDTAQNWISVWMQKDMHFADFDALKQYALSQGPATVSMLYDMLTREAQVMGVANPLVTGAVHQWMGAEGTSPNRLIDSFRNRLLTSQYSMLYGDEPNIERLLQRRFNALKMKLAIIFIDIRGFTGWSTERSPDEIIGMLNKEQSLILRIINSTGGRLNKSMGDGLLAYYPETKIPECLMAAIKIHKELKKVSLLPVGIGIDFGEVVLGDIGEELRIDFTLIGSTVNNSSRCCDSAGKHQITMGETFYSQLPEPTRIFIGEFPDFAKISSKRKPLDPELTAFRFTAV